LLVDVVNLFSTPLESYKAPDNQIVEWHSKASDINQDSDEEMTDKKNGNFLLEESLF
jgi:hypothetical protein